MPNNAEDIFRFVPQLRDTGTDTRVQNVFYGQVTVLVDPTDQAIEADAITMMTDIYNQVAGLISDSVTGENIRITNVTNRERVGQPDWPFTGGVPGGEGLPPQVAAQVLFPLKATGRTGRTYFGPFVETVQSDGEWSAAAKTALGNAGQAIANLFNGNVSGNEYQLGIARFVAGGALQDFTEFRDGVFEVTDFARTQRRRTAGVGLT